LRLEAIELKKNQWLLCFCVASSTKQLHYTAVLRASKQPKRPEASSHPLLCFIEAVKQKQPLWMIYQGTKT